MKKFKIGWKTADGLVGSNELLTDRNLNTIGLSSKEIKKADPFFAFPGPLYTEEGVARSEHPCCGSAGVNIITHDGRTASIQDIFYHDQGHKSGQYRGIPHWNRQRRYINTQGKEKRMSSDKDHILPDSVWIKTTLIDGTGKEKKQKIRRKYPAINSECLKK